MKLTNKLLITDIQRFCMHDGPGVRTNVFLKGCPLRCKWCHNPETNESKPELLFLPNKCIGCGQCVEVCNNDAHSIDTCHIFNRSKCIACGNCAKVCPSLALNLSGEEKTPEEIIEVVMKDFDFYGEKGGLTVSGGEPTMQYDGLIELLKLAKDRRISTCIETCGMFNKSKTELLSNYVDTFLYDIKDTDAERLKSNTGADLDLILDNLKTIDSLGKVSVIRCIIIPDINMNTEHMIKLSKIYNSLKNVQHIEFMPYHPFGISKAIQIGSFQEEYRKPEKSELLDLAKVLKKENVKVKIEGNII